MAPGDPFLHAHRSRDVIWMSQNTNTIPLETGIEQAVRDALDAGLHRLYPYGPGLPGLPEAILADHGLNADHSADGPWSVHIASGCIEALDMVNRTLVRPGSEVIATDPSFLPIHHQVTRLGGTVLEVPIYEPPWRLTPDAVSDRISSNTAYVLLIDPINPLGTAYPAVDVRAIAEICRDAHVPLVHDVTYRDFSPGHQLATEWYPEGTYVAFSFSKWAGLAGMRIGGVIAPRARMVDVKRFDPNVLSVNVLAQTAAFQALRTKGTWLPQLLGIVSVNQAIIQHAVAAVEGCFLPVYPSHANMMLIDTSGTGVHPDRIQEELLYKHEVFIRSGTYVSPRFGDRFVRVSFTVPTSECDRFAEAFPRVLQKLRV